MVKHWYGYGAQEGGRDSHFASGKYAVYPGNNLAEHKLSFIDGAFELEGGTEMASAVMPIYSILWNQDPSGENVGGSYSQWLIQKQLREEAKFEGVVCTDWGITKDMKVLDSPMGGKPWGVESLTEAERHYKILQAGVDQYGGNNEIGPVLAAYDMWAKAQGEKSARQRFEQSARRLLLNVFRVGLFEHPYLDPEASEKIVGNPQFMREGYEAQLKSVVMLKNHDNKTLPMDKRYKVYVPKRHFPAIPGLWGGISEEKTVEPIDLALVRKYYEVVEQPEQADFAICLIEEPSTGFGYSAADVKRGGNGYVPYSLQYDDYKAVDARSVSIAGGDPMEKFTNRSYKGKTVKAYNRDDMLMVSETKRAMGEKPVIVILETGRPVVLSEIEPKADAILVSFNVQHQALLDIISGKNEPSALLPMQMPADMKTVEEQNEDVPRDMRCYQDADGNTYDFAFGLNWQGVIKDERVKNYK
jgi:beta-glucosidase